MAGSNKAYRKRSLSIWHAGLSLVVNDCPTCNLELTLMLSLYSCAQRTSYGNYPSPRYLKHIVTYLLLSMSNRPVIQHHLFVGKEKAVESVESGQRVRTSSIYYESILVRSFRKLRRRQREVAVR